MTNQQSAVMAGGPRLNGNKGPGPEIMSAKSLAGDSVTNLDGESIGDIKDIMIDMRTGKVAYAVLSFGSILGMGEKLFAIPWGALWADSEGKKFVLNVAKDRLKDAPGFDKDHWPNMADSSWAAGIHSHYGVQI